MRKLKFFKLVRIRFEKQVSEVQKKSENQTFEISVLGEKIAKLFFSKNVCLL